MDARTRARFERMWRAGKPLAEIAEKLRYSFSTLAKLRIMYGLERRYGSDEDETPPTRAVIRLRCQQQQTNWTESERKQRWQGEPHTIYASITSYDEPT